MRLGARSWRNVKPIDPPFTFVAAVRAVWDGFLLRCPRCRRGPMFASGFTMHPTCPACALAFQRASGEEVGGMMINLVITSLVVIAAGSIAAGFTRLPIWVILLTLGTFACLFPIAFYRASRGIWAAFLYVLRINDESD
jgi:uncharacterized protein (DUF983 family)